MQPDMYCVADKSRMEPLSPRQLGASVIAAVHIRKISGVLFRSGSVSFGELFAVLSAEHDRKALSEPRIWRAPK
jgi:hypothetical protein